MTLKKKTISSRTVKVQRRLFKATKDEGGTGYKEKYRELKNKKKKKGAKLNERVAPDTVKHLFRVLN